MVVVAAGEVVETASWVVAALEAGVVAVEVAAEEVTAEEAADGVSGSPGVASSGLVWLEADAARMLKAGA